MPSHQIPLFPTDEEPPLSAQSTLAEAIPHFARHLRDEGRSPHTISAFQSDLRLALEFFGKLPLSRFTTSRLARFMEWVEHGRGVPCSRKTYARRVTTLKVFFKYLKSVGVTRSDPAEALLQRSGAAPLQTILSHDDLDRLLAQTALMRQAEKPDPRPDLLVRLLLDTGIKKGECMRLTPSDVVDVRGGEPILIVRHRSPNDVYKERKVALDPDWVLLLDEYLAQYRPNGAIFECTARNLEYILHDVALAAGIQGAISFEIMRWTSAVRDYQRGMDLDKLREKLGLSRISWRETSEKIIQLAAPKPVE